MPKVKDKLNPKVIVFDNGAGFSKIGFSGESLPRRVLPTSINDQFPIINGLIKDWEAMKNFWNYSFETVLGVDPSEHPILITESSLNPGPNREKLTEIMFETFKVPGLFIASQASLALLASGRETGFVIDIGHNTSQFVSIWKRFELAHHTQKINLAGIDVTDYLSRLLRQKGYNLANSTELEEIPRIKETLCYIPLDIEREMANTKKLSGKEFPYILPTGDALNIGVERFLAPECLFNPSLIGKEINSLDEIIVKIIRAFDVDITRNMCSNIVLSGGSSMFPGLAERLTKEIKKNIWESVDVRIIIPPDSRYLTWIGGSTLSSIETFQNKWVTKKEYSENGPKAIHRYFGAFNNL